MKEKIINFGGKVLCVAWVCLELEILLLQPSECWDYRHTPPNLAIVLRFLILFILYPKC
jgi:hypothetical protein